MSGDSATNLLRAPTLFEADEVFHSLLVPSASAECMFFMERRGILEGREDSGFDRDHRRVPTRPARYNVRVTGDHGQVRTERSDGADALGRPCRLAGYGADEAGKTCGLQFAATEDARQLARAPRIAKMDEALAGDP